jgi:hypothetical protein
MGEIEQAAEARKKEITRAIKPVGGITALPPLLGEPKRVLLIVPPGTLEEYTGRLSGAAGELPMLGLAFIAASLRDLGHLVKLIDYELNAWAMSRVEHDIRAFRPDLIGMTVYITNMRRCASVATIAKRVDPAVTVVVGGPQVTIFPEEAFLCPDIDMAVLSEGEIIIRNVMNALGDQERLREVKGIWFRDGRGEVVRNEREMLVDNLDIFPPPVLDLYDMKKYFPLVYIRGRRVAHLLTSRGCPFRCAFCETKLTFGRSFRYHSAERVLGDLERLIEQSYDGFQFYDDIFTANKVRVVELCQGIIDRGWKIQWMCYTRTNTLSPDMLELMRKAGCYMDQFRPGDRRRRPAQGGEQGPRRRPEHPGLHPDQGGGNQDRRDLHARPAHRDSGAEREVHPLRPGPRHQLRHLRHHRAVSRHRAVGGRPEIRPVLQLREVPERPAVGERGGADSQWPQPRGTKGADRKSDVEILYPPQGDLAHADEFLHAAAAARVSVLVGRRGLLHRGTAEPLAFGAAQLARKEPSPCRIR